MMKIQLEDLILEVDTDTGTAILQNENYAAEYLKAVRGQLLQNKGEPAAPNSTKKTKVWTTTKETTEDSEATQLLLKLRKELDEKFADSHTAKNTIWQNIAGQLNKSGYYVGDGVEGREKVRIKFNNLHYSFTKYYDKVKRTGEGKIKKPVYFDELYEILGDKHKINPPLIIDSGTTNVAESFASTSSSLSVPLPVSTASTCNSNKTNRFTTTANSSKPKSSRDLVLEQLLTIQKENQTQKKEEFKEFSQMFMEESRLRHEQMMALISSMKSKKRRRSSSSD